MKPRPAGPCWWWPHWGPLHARPRPERLYFERDDPDPGGAGRLAGSLAGSVHCKYAARSEGARAGGTSTRRNCSTKGPWKKNNRKQEASAASTAHGLPVKAHGAEGLLGARPAKEDVCAYSPFARQVSAATLFFSIHTVFHPGSARSPLRPGCLIANAVFVRRIWAGVKRGRGGARCG